MNDAMIIHVLHSIDSLSTTLIFSYSPSTADDLARELGADPISLRSEISESHRLDIADFIDWKAVGPRLDGITTVFGMDGRDQLDLRRKLVHMWWQKNGHRATYHAMITAMLKVGRRADAGKVCKLLIGEKKNYTTRENNSDTIIVSPHYMFSSQLLLQLLMAPVKPLQYLITPYMVV